MYPRWMEIVGYVSLAIFAIMALVAHILIAVPLPHH
jgi:hypothetical protein